MTTTPQLAEEGAIGVGRLDADAPTALSPVGPSPAVSSASPLRSHDADGWIKWTGGVCPVEPETRVRVKFRSPLQWGHGMTFSARDFVGSDPDDAPTNNWLHSDRADDIIAYRVVQS